MRTRWFFLAGLLGVALLFGACDSGDDSGDTTAEAVDDCVADGTCSPGPEGTQAAAAADNGWTVDGTYLGLPVGFTDDGFPYIGQPDAAVTLVEYSDYLCPFCSRHTNQTTPALLLEYGNSGDVNFVFRDFPLVGLHPTAPAGHQASLCVVEQGAAGFWGFHDTLFREQDQWANLADPIDYLAQTAGSLGVDMTAYNECMTSGRTALLVDQRVAAGNAAGFNGTPSFHLLNNSDGSSYDVVGAQPLDIFAAAFDALLAGEAPTGLASSPGAASTDAPVAAPTFTVDPETQDEYEGFTVGFTEEGLPFIGEPDAAVTVLEYSDYLCPFCFRHTTETTPALLEEYAGVNGDVNFVFVDLPLVSLHPTAPRGHQAALCVAEQGAAFFWAYHDWLFVNQNQWSGLQDPTDYLRQTAEALGVDMSAYDSCMDDGRTVATVDERVARGTSIGFNGTPSFQFLNNSSEDVYELVGAHPLETFQSYLDAMVAGEEPADAVPDDEPPELPVWASAEGLVPNPSRPGYTVAGDAYKGDPSAPVVVVEFSDFQCPSCARHALDTQPAIDEALVDTGQIMWVFKHFPLSIHPQAAVAAAAAECAGEQGAFFEMETALFTGQETWSVDDPDEIFVGLAGDLGLNVDDFSSCYPGRTAVERVLADTYDALEVATQTPTFVILHSGRGTLLEGARDAESFVALLEGQVENALAEPSDES